MQVEHLMTFLPHIQNPVIVPCHRMPRTDGSIMAMLLEKLIENEGVNGDGSRMLDFR